MEIQIRKYRGSDKKNLRQFIAGLQHHIAELDDLKRLRKVADFDTEAYLKRTFEYLKKRNGVIFMAEENGKLLGSIIGVISKKEGIYALEAYPSKDGRVLELFVSSDARGKGVGSLLMQKMEDYFRENGCKASTVECFAPNKEALKFYQRSGYVERLICSIKKL